MDTLTAHAKPLRYPLKSPTFLPQSGDGWLLPGIDLRVRVGMFEQELTPVAPACDILGVTHLEAHRPEEGTFSR